MFIAWFNYYVNKGMVSLVSIDNSQKGAQSLELQDSTGKIAGYLNEGVQFKDKYLAQAYSYIDKGIKLHPDRLDMRFGKIYMLGETGKFNQFAEEIIKAVDYNTVIKSRWRWQDNKPLDDAENYLLSSIQSYINTLYNAGDEQLPLMKDIAMAILKYYPNHVESLSNIAMTYIINGNNDEGLKYLKKAEAAAPSDVVVLNNIAEVYSRNKDKENAKKYYQKIIASGDAESVEDAKTKLKNLN
jgi:tetratricopeptide (TPR) repeat protein